MEENSKSGRKQEINEKNTTQKKKYVNWQVVSVIVILVLGGISSFYYFKNIELTKEKNSLERPLLITPDKRVIGNSLADLSFIIKNPSYSIDYYYVSGNCMPDVPELFISPPSDVKAQDTNQNINQNKNNLLLIQSTSVTEIPIKANNEISLQCSNNYVQNPSRDGVTFLTVCVNIKNIKEPICSRMQVTILKS